MCHLIFFLPFFGLPVFWIFPFNIALPVYLFIIGISMLLYYKIFQAMRAKVRNGQEAMLGKTGVVLKNIDPEGKIKYATEIWNPKGKSFWKVKKWSSAAFHMACES
jgi:membrane protein implicated in regulation of membrane protease activity